MPDGVLTALLAAAAEEPSFDPDEVTPGLPGFLVTFAIVVAVVFLLRDFTRRVRRLQFRGEQLEREEAERAAARDAEARGAEAEQAGAAGAGLGGPAGVGPD
ncbi:MAG: hypothetical protein AVDCRST_MAG35-2346, partial [uncultured Quadrisphaera sp.]